MPLNAATYADELAMKAGKPHSGMKGKDGKLRRGWKGFYGSVHDIVSLRDCRIVRLQGCEGLGGPLPGYACSCDARQCLCTVLTEVVGDVDGTSRRAEPV